MNYRKIADLSDQEIEDLRARYVAGETLRQLSASSGISLSAIGRLAAKEVWSAKPGAAVKQAFNRAAVQAAAKLGKVGLPRKSGH